MKGKYTPFGNRLAYYLKERQYSQSEFVKRLKAAGYPHNVTQQEVSNWLRLSQRLYPEWFHYAREILRLSDDELAELLWLYYISAKKSPKPGKASGPNTISLRV
jgi:transcriptional regulator with XRE-family HTH domain